LALETSGQVAGVAIATEEKVLCSFHCNIGLAHSETLMGMVEKSLEIAGLDLADMDVIACSAGPGSFTGVRIGAASAKALAFAANKRIAAVPTLSALAYNIFDAQAIIAPIMDARAQEVYYSLFEWRDGAIAPLMEPIAASLADAVKKASSFGRRIIFCGDGSVAMRANIEALCKELGASFNMAPCAHLWQRPDSVACLGALMALEGKTEPAESFKPVYLRLPQAERERLKRLAKA
jgi:tRNA threonylcarbamoyladenosine biosynthesis protein TsaB